MTPLPRTSTCIVGPACHDAMYGIQKDCPKRAAALARASLVAVVPGSEASHRFECLGAPALERSQDQSGHQPAATEQEGGAVEARPDESDDQQADQRKQHEPEYPRVPPLPEKEI